MKDWFLAYADDVLVQTAHEQGIPKLLIYYGVPKKHKHESYFSGFFASGLCAFGNNEATLNLLGHGWICGERDQSRQQPFLPFQFSIKQDHRHMKESEKQTAELTHAFKVSI